MSKLNSSLALALGLSVSHAAAQVPPGTAPPPPAAQPAPAAQAAPPPYYPPPPYPYPPPYYPPPYYYPPPVPYYAPTPVAPPVEPPAWKPGEPAPRGYHVDSHPEWKTVGQGAALFGVFWVVSVIGGAIANEAEDTNDGDGVQPGDWSVLYVPVVGPFFALEYVDTKDSGWAFLLLDGVFQSVGALGIVIGLVSREERLVKNEARLVLPELRLAPTFGQNRGGLSVSGRF